MSKLLSSAAFKWSRWAPWLNQRYSSCCVGGKRQKAPLCKGRKIAQPERKCPPKEGSCYAVMGACPKITYPDCVEPDIRPPAYLSCCSDQRLTENPCKRVDKKLQKQGDEKPFVSMWESCGLENVCPEAKLRLDEVYYKPTDKIKRVYTQTWKNCTPLIRKRKLCFFNEMTMLPPINKRRKTECPATAKEQDAEQLKEDYKVLKKCLQEKVKKLKTKGKGKCEKITMPCCRKVAKNLKCHKHQRPKCVRECCPHPSFSECEQPEFRREMPVECRCSHFITKCDADRFLHRKQFFSLPPPLPAWPPQERPK